MLNMLETISAFNALNDAQRAELFDTLENEVKAEAYVMYADKTLAKNPNDELGKIAIDIVKDETGWTYWQYERNSQLSSALKEYMNEKHQRRQRHKEIRKLVQEKRDQYKKSC